MCFLFETSNISSIKHIFRIPDFLFLLYIPTVFLQIHSPLSTEKTSNAKYLYIKISSTANKTAEKFCLTVFWSHLWLSGIRRGKNTSDVYKPALAINANPSADTFRIPLLRNQQFQPCGYWLMKPCECPSGTAGNETNFGRCRVCLVNFLVRILALSVLSVYTFLTIFIQICTFLWSWCQNFQTKTWHSTYPVLQCLKITFPA